MRTSALPTPGTPAQAINVKSTKGAAKAATGTTLLAGVTAGEPKRAAPSQREPLCIRRDACKYATRRARQRCARDTAVQLCTSHGQLLVLRRQQRDPSDNGQPSGPQAKCEDTPTRAALPVPTGAAPLTGRPHAQR